MYDTIKISTTIHLNTNKLMFVNGWIKKTWKGKGISLLFYKNKVIRFVYIPLWHKLYAEFSFPKLIYGSNVFMVYDKDLKPLIKRFREIAAKALYCPVPNLINWEVSRVDFCYNFYCNSIDCMNKYIKALQLLDITYFKTKKYPTTALFKNKSHSFKMYIKAFEMQAKGEKVEEWMYTILRFEVTLRRRKVKELFGDKNGNVNLGNVVKEN